MKIHGLLSVPIIFACAFFANCNFPGNSLKGSGNVVEESREVAPIHRLVVDGPIDVYLNQGEEQSVSVKGEDNIIPFVTTENREGLLRISLEKLPRSKPIRSTKEIKVYVTVPSITSLRVSGSGDVIGSGKWRFEKMKIYINGSGDVWLSLSGNELKVISRGSGDLHLDGKVSGQDISLFGSGDYKASGLESQKAVLILEGSGVARLDVRQNLDAQLFGSGDAHYYGKPQINSTISGSGKLIAKEGSKNEK